MVHLRRRSLAAASLVGTVAVAGSLVGYTPIACGCLTPWQELADRSGLPRDSWQSVTAEKLKAGLEKYYRGIRLSMEYLPPQADCSLSNSRRIRCTNWLWKRHDPKSGLDDLKGYEMTFLISKDGVFESVHVVEIETPPWR